MKTQFGAIAILNTTLVVKRNIFADTFILLIIMYAISHNIAMEE